MESPGGRHIAALVVQTVLGTEMETRTDLTRVHAHTDALEALLQLRDSFPTLFALRGGTGGSGDSIGVEFVGWHLRRADLDGDRDSDNDSDSERGREARGGGTARGLDQAQLARLSEVTLACLHRLLQAPPPPPSQPARPGQHQRQQQSQHHSRMREVKSFVEFCIHKYSSASYRHPGLLVDVVAAVAETEAQHPHSSQLSSVLPLPTLCQAVYGASSGASWEGVTRMFSVFLAYPPRLQGTPRILWCTT